MSVVEWITQNKERGTIFADTEKWPVPVLKMEARPSWKVGAAMSFDYCVQYTISSDFILAFDRMDVLWWLTLEIFIGPVSWWPSSLEVIS